MLGGLEVLAPGGGRVVHPGEPLREDLLLLAHRGELSVDPRDALGGVGDPGVRLLDSLREFGQLPRDLVEPGASRRQRRHRPRQVSLDDGELPAHLLGARVRGERRADQGGSYEHAVGRDERCLSGARRAWRPPPPATRPGRCPSTGWRRAPAPTGPPRRSKAASARPRARTRRARHRPPRAWRPHRSGRRPARAPRPRRRRRRRASPSPARSARSQPSIARIS